MRKIIQVDNDHVVFYELIAIGNSTFMRDPVPHVVSSGLVLGQRPQNFHGC